MHNILYVPRQLHLKRDVVVQIWEGNAVLCADWLTDDDLVDVVELIPILISVKYQFAFNQLA